MERLSISDGTLHEDVQPLLTGPSSINVFEDPLDPQLKMKDDKKPKERLVSLDMFRGLTIWFMILVNNADAGNGPYKILEHADWDGVTIADFVMPCFLFIVGMSITLALKNVHRSSSLKSKIPFFQRAATRAAKLFALGLLLHFPHYNLKTIRILGVLQRIAICYFIVSVVIIFVPPLRRSTGRLLSVCTQYLAYWVISLGIMIIYLGIMFGVQVPGCPKRGMLTPPCNAAGWIDYNILTPNHMYAWPTCLWAEPPCKYFDPEGLLTTFVATASVFCGVYYGYVIQNFQFHSQRVVQWIIPSFVQIAIALTIHFTFMPFNKNLYSISYIFLMGGSAGLLFILCYLVLDVVRFRIPGWPFVWLGSNSIILYVGDALAPVILGPSSSVLIYYGDPSNSFGAWIRATFYDSWLNQDNANLIWAISRACFWMLPAFILYKLKIFIRV